MGNVFVFIYDIFQRHRWAFFLFMALLIAFEGWFGSRIRLEEDINKVIPASEKNRELITVLRHSKFSDRLVVCISLDEQEEAADPRLLVSFAASLIDSLQNSEASGYISLIESNFAPGSGTDVYGTFYENLPFLLEPDDYRDIGDRIGDSVIARAIADDYRALVSPGGFVMRDFILGDPLSLTSIALGKLEDLRVSENFDLYDGHIVSSDRRNLLFFIIPSNPGTETSENARLLDMLDRFAANVGQHYQQKASVVYFGSAAVSTGNAAQIKKDILATVSIAVVLLLLFIGFYFRRRVTFLLLFIPAVFGGAFSLALLYLIRGEVSAISLGLGSVMLGISVDYALHFLNHLRHTASVRTVIRDIAGPVMMSSLTTASAFLCLLVLRSEAMRDLGLFAAITIFSSAIFSLVILPQMFSEKHEQSPASSRLSRMFEKVASYPWHKKKKLAWLIVLLFIIFLFTSRKVEFESNMDSMNYMSEELKQSEDFLDSISSYKLRSVFVVSASSQLDSALAGNEGLIPLIDSLAEEGTIKRYQSVHPYYPSAVERTRRLERWRTFWAEGRKDRVEQAIAEAAREYRFRDNTFDGFYELLEYPQGDRGLEGLAPLREVFLDEFIAETDSLALVTTVLKVEEQDKPLVYSAFEGKPGVIVFDRQSLTSSFMEGLRDNFDRLIILSLALVFVILTLSFGRIELGIITFIPLLISWVFTLGIMGLLDIRFNIFNVVISSFIFGLGIDYAIFCMRGLMQEYQYGEGNSDSYKTSILLSGITTIAGIGVLIFAKHPALQSIAISAIIGITSVIFITYTILPVLFRFLIIHEGRTRRWPVTFRDFLFSLNTLAIFLAGVTVLNISGLVLKYLVPMKTRNKKLIFHQMLSLACRIIVYGSWNIRKTVRNLSGEDFRKPAVVICNHQSHLDTVLNIMQNPRMILLTHPWVQKSIFFGWFVRFADFLPVDKGLGPIMDQMREIVREGYSVFVFPEGTRSYNLNIGRFHQGAFYISRELGLDILPVISYGSGNAMPKFEPFLKTSPTSITVLPRISHDDPMLSGSLLEVSKRVRRHMKERYAVIRQEFETPSFFRKKVVRNYLYRGPVLEWYMKVKIRMESHYRLFHENLPASGQITDIGCGYGFMAYMLHLMAPGRKITGYDYDADKIDTANHCALNDSHTAFIHADISTIDPPLSDAFILADVLHYMPVEEQEILIRKCAGRLKAGGVMIIRDADRDMRKKHLGTRISEILSTGIGFNKTAGLKNRLFFSTRSHYLSVFDSLGFECRIIDQTRLTSNLVYIVRKVNDEI